MTASQQQERRNNRSRNTLHGRMVSDGMKERYYRSVSMFLRFVDHFNYVVRCWENLDEVVSEWLEHIFHDGQHKTLASDGLAGLQYFLPQAMGRLRHSWKLTKVWQKLEPPRRVLPFSPLMSLAFAGVAAELGLLAEASGVLVGFDAMLRSGELYRLRIRDIAFYGKRAVLSLGYTKTGKRTNSTEMVVVEAQIAVKLLRLACHGRPRHERLLWRGERFFRALFNMLLEFFDLDGLITVYSLRRGGASWDFLQHQSLERTLLRGRWASTSSARIYLQDATAMLTHLQLSSEQHQLASAALRKLLRKLDG